MKRHIKPNTNDLLFRVQKLFALLALTIGTLHFSSTGVAQVYDGDGLAAGAASPGDGGESLRSFIEEILFVAVSYVGLAGVVMMIIAGIMFIFSAGEDGLKEKAKKIIIFTVVGIVVILVASAIVFLLVNITDPAAPID